MNTNVWVIIKICKALNPSSWVISSWVFCFRFQQQSYVHPPPHESKTRERSLCQQFLCTNKLSSSKCFFSVSQGFNVPWASHHFLLPRVWCLHLPYYRTQKKTRLPLNAPSRLATDLHPHSIVFGCRQHRGPGGGRRLSAVLGSEGTGGPGICLSLSAPGGDVKAGDHHEMGLAEVDAALQALGDALEGLQVLQGIQLQHLLQVDCKRGRAGWRKNNPICSARPQGCPISAPLSPGLIFFTCLRWPWCSLLPNPWPFSQRIETLVTSFHISNILLRLF